MIELNDWCLEDDVGDVDDGRRSQPSLLYMRFAVSTQGPEFKSSPFRNECTTPIDDGLVSRGHNLVSESEK